MNIVGLYYFISDLRVIEILLKAWTSLKKIKYPTTKKIINNTTVAPNSPFNSNSYRIIEVYNIILFLVKPNKLHSISREA